MANLPYTYIVKGKYWRFRRGKLHTALPGAPGEKAFHEKYAELLRLSETAPAKPDETSIAWLVKRYRASVEFKALRDSTQLDYEKTLDLITAELGEEPYRLITGAMVKAVRDDLAATPRKAHKVKQMVSRLYTWAHEESLVRKDHNPAADFKKLKVRAKTITPWSEEEIALWLTGARPFERTALLLLLYTGQRCEDVASMDWTAFQGDFIRVRQSKTNEPLEIACHPTLRAQLTAVKTRFKGPITRNAMGRPYKTNALRKMIIDRCDSIEAMPSNRSPHGLRYAAAAKMEEAGCTIGEITSVIGHRTYQMAMKYALARRESTAAMARISKSA